MAANAPGKLVIISGPSGAGKTTVLKRVLEQSTAPLVLSVSATTREPRPGEQEGVDYFFLSSEEFSRRRQHGEFLETCEVFQGGHWYGTLLSQVTPSLQEGKWVVLEIDVQGTKSVLVHYPDALTIFVRPVSLAELERRLRLRGTETEAGLQRRLEVARQELEQAGLYRYQVMNEDLDRAVQEICDILSTAGGPKND